MTDVRIQAVMCGSVLGSNFLLLTIVGTVLPELNVATGFPNIELVSATYN